MLNGLINLDSYTPVELILFSVGCYMWVLVYGIYIRQILKHKFVEMPIFAACSNIAWEFVWGFVPPSTDMGSLLVWAYRIWFLIDIFIFVGLLKYGAVHVTTPYLKKYFKQFSIIAAICWGIVYYFFKSGGYDTPIGANSAYIAQTFISVLYVILILKEHRLEWFSFPVAWLKMIGTLLITVFQFMHYPDNHFLQSLCVISSGMDIVYIVLFVRRRKEEQANSVKVAYAA